MPPFSNSDAADLHSSIHALRLPVMKTSLLFLALLLVGLGRQPSFATAAPESSALLDAQGHRFLDAGQAEQAIQSWEQALDLYRQQKHQAAIQSVLINQAIAHQQLGQPKLACAKLTEALDINNGVCHTPEQADASVLQSSNQRQAQGDGRGFLSAGLRPVEDHRPYDVIAMINLGKTLRILGDFANAEGVLLSATGIANRSGVQSYRDAAQLELADLKQAQFTTLYQAASTTDRLDISAIDQDIQRSLSKLSEALDLYSGLVASSEDLPAQLSWLELYQKAAELATMNGQAESKLTQFLAQRATPYQRLVVQIVNAEFKSSIYQTINAQNRLANHLVWLEDQAGLKEPLSFNPQQEALRHVNQALQMAESLDNPRSLSTSHGTLGLIYQRQSQPEQAAQSYRQAQKLAQSIRAVDLQYRWEWELAKLYADAGQTPTALDFYRQAIASLDQVRNNLFSLRNDLQFSFLLDISPVYRDYMQLLMTQETPDLDNVVKVNEKLQLVELEDYLNCGNLTQRVTQRRWYPTGLSPTGSKQRPSPTPDETAIHIIQTQDAINVIVQGKDNQFYSHRADPKTVLDNLNRLRLNVNSDNFAITNPNRIQALSSELYKTLILPIESHLSPERPLIFSLDSQFQSIPMAMLYDGERYLLEKYRIAARWQLQEVQFTPTLSIKPLIAGISQVGPSFSQVGPNSLLPLPNVSLEVTEIAKTTQASDPLLDNQFTLDRFSRQLQARDVDVVHISTHGAFSSNPEDTFLLAWDQKLGLGQIETLFETRRRVNGTPIELLVLSACQTAKGDQRASLGLAGVAMRSGAHSTIASLWNVADESTAILMKLFYTGLAQGLPKVEALRQAQLKVMQMPQYQSPYYWAPFILIGDWR
jgi:CHAT domain-containing protein/Tfp pilus assembly protein PilF